MVSVVVPCYNYGHYLPDALRSVLQQSCPDWECIVVDDGSRDHTGEVAQQFTASDQRFRYVYQENRGLSAARNTGIRSSHGEFVQFLDADDLIEPRKLERQLAFLKANPAVDVVYSEVKFFSASPDNITQIGNWEYMCYASGQGEALLAAMLEKNITVVSAPLLRKRVIEKAGTFDETLRAVEDYDFWLRCALAGCRFQYSTLGEDATLIRKGHDSMSGSALKMLRNNVAVRRKIGSRLPDGHLTKRNKLYLDEIITMYGDQLYKASVYLDFGRYFYQLMQAAVGVKHPYLLKLLIAAATDKTMQVLSSLKKDESGIGKSVTP